MKPLIFGKTGQVARELRKVMAKNPDAHFLGRDDADLTDPAACAAIAANANCDVIINVAAYTGVDAAETDAATATIVNTKAPLAIAQAAAKRNVPFLHVSTDYVFDGSGDTPFQPADPTGPLGVYGQTKLDGERGIQAAGGLYAVLRTSWVFSAHGSNFLKTMLRLGAERETLNVVADQVGGPTPAPAIAETLQRMASAMYDGHRGGIFHYSGADDVSWADFARAIMQAGGLDCAVGDIATTDYPTPARRPGNSRLDCVDIEREFGVSRPDWRAYLPLMIEELRNEAA